MKTGSLMRQSQLHRNLLWLILALAVALRVAVALYLGDSVPSGKDEYSYSALGARVADGYGFSFDTAWYPFAAANSPTAHWSFLYAGFIGAVYAITGEHPLVIRLLGAVLGGILLPWLSFRLVRRVVPKQEGLALLTAAGAAIYAYFVLYAAMVMTETLFISGLLWSLERASKLKQDFRSGRRVAAWEMVVFGVSLGMTALVRQSILPWYVVQFGALCWVAWRAGALQRAVPALTIAGVVLLLCIAPFTLRNYRVYGEFLLLNSNTGYAMYSAQHPLHGTSFQAFTAAPLPDDLDLSLNEAQLDRELLRRGLAFVAADPVRYLRLSASRAIDFFMFWPSGETTLLHNVGRVASYGVFLPFFVHGLWLSRRTWRRYWMLYAFGLVYTVLHLLTWAMIRYRLPVDAVFLVFAALSVQALSRRWIAVPAVAVDG